MGFIAVPQEDRIVNLAPDFTIRTNGGVLPELGSVCHDASLQNRTRSCNHRSGLNLSVFTNINRPQCTIDDNCTYFRIGVKVYILLPINNRVLISGFRPRIFIIYECEKSLKTLGERKSSSVKPRAKIMVNDPSRKLAVTSSRIIARIVLNQRLNFLL